MWRSWCGPGCARGTRRAALQIPILAFTFDVAICDKEGGQAGAGYLDCRNAGFDELLRERSTAGLQGALRLLPSSTAFPCQKTIAQGRQAMIMVRTITVLIYLRTNSLYLASPFSLLHAAHEAARAAAALPSCDPRHQSSAAEQGHALAQATLRGYPAHAAQHRPLGRGVFRPMVSLKSCRGDFPLIAHLFIVRGRDGPG